MLCPLCMPGLESPVLEIILKALRGWFLGWYFVKHYWIYSSIVLYDVCIYCWYLSFCLTVYRCSGVYSDTTMSETIDSGINVTQLSEISNDLEIISETKFDLKRSNSEQCKADMEVLMDSITLTNADKMIHNPKTIGAVTDFTPAQVTKLLKCRLVATFIFITCVVMALYQIPLVLFYVNINPKLSDSDVTDHVDFKSCFVNVSVSYCMAPNFYMHWKLHEWGMIADS